MRRLTAPAHDTEALAAVLADQNIAGFDVTTLINEPHHRVGAAIGDFYRNRRRDDLTLLYFTGHGLKDDDGGLYLAMTDTLRENLLFTGLAAARLNQAMDNCVSRQKVLVLDCCYSGAFPASHAKGDTAVHALARFHGSGRTVLTASDATQYSFEGDSPVGHAPRSIFTHHLVSGLRDGTADLDGDGDITLDELYSYVHDRVIEAMPHQRPKRQDNVEGRMVIAHNINWTLPSYLRNAIASPIAADRLAAIDGLAHLLRVGNNLVRSQVLAEIVLLADDDSRRVSAAAAELLSATAPPAGQPQTVPHQPESKHPATTSPETPPEPETAPPREAGPEPEPESLAAPAQPPPGVQQLPEGGRPAGQSPPGAGAPAGRRPAAERRASGSSRPPAGERAPGQRRQSPVIKKGEPDSQRPVIGRLAEPGAGRRRPSPEAKVVAFGLSIVLLGLAAAIQTGYGFVGALILVAVLGYFVWK